MAWAVRLSDRARKDIKKLDRQIATRKLRFFHKRIKGENDPRSIGAALDGSELESSGGIVSGTGGRSAGSKMKRLPFSCSRSNIGAKSINDR